VGLLSFVLIAGCVGHAVQDLLESFLFVWDPPVEITTLSGLVLSWKYGAKAKD
jgi:hypothetical protein